VVVLVMGVILQEALDVSAAMTFDPLAPLPLVTADLPGVGGRIKDRPEDFEVEELPAYAPSGQGEFLYLWVEKRGMGAEYFVRQVARRLGVAPDEVGTAGLKDRHAVTRQMVSVPGRAEANLPQLDGDGVRLLSVSRHANKLKPGHLHGNRFTILVRDVAPDAADRLPALVACLRQMGLPNFYGPQRFGRDGETLKAGLALLAGQETGRLSHFLRRLALSAAQSALFNRFVAARMGDGLFRRVIAGDVMAKWPHGGMFIADDVAREQARFDAREVIPTGPMFGRKMFPSPTGEASRREEELLREAGLSRAAFGGFGKLLGGTRRYALVYVDDLTAAPGPEGAILQFTLPAGSYATVLIRELTHSIEMQGEDAG
jgi:tRNA pseudouridine13 synthase